MDFQRTDNNITGDH